jgi:DNA replication protein DnaD
VINDVDELGEARYLISKLYAMTVNQSVAVAQQEQANKNLETRMKQVDTINFCFFPIKKLELQQITIYVSSFNEELSQVTKF